MRKTIEELKKLNTKRLLSYYRAERKRYNISIESYLCGFDSVKRTLLYTWDKSDDEYYLNKKVEHDEWLELLCSVKIELDSRENIS